EVRYLALDGGQPLSLRIGGFGARSGAFDHTHAVGKSTDLSQAETRRYHALDLPDLRDSRTRKCSVAIARADGREQAAFIVLTDRAHACTALACQPADGQPARGNGLGH